MWMNLMILIVAWATGRVRHMDYCAEYGFEYQGVCSRMVLTPETDRCWLNITQAFAGGSVAAVQGAVGFGKSETVKDLALEAGTCLWCITCLEMDGNLAAAPCFLKLRHLIGVAFSCFVMVFPLREGISQLQPSMMVASGIVPP